MAGGVTGRDGGPHSHHGVVGSVRMWGVGTADRFLRSLITVSKLTAVQKAIAIYRAYYEQQKKKKKTAGLIATYRGRGRENMELTRDIGRQH